MVPDIPADRLEAVAMRLRREYGGLRTYVRTPTFAEREQRAVEARRLFTGRNPSEVARMLGISRATVYRKLRG